MSVKPNYFKIGLFLLSGIGLCLVTAVALSVGLFGRDEFTVETYINESVQGLSVGSPFKYRGVQIGTVKEIGFTFSEYTRDSDGNHIPPGKRAKYVLVRMAVWTDAVGADRRQGLQRLKDYGGDDLRIKIKSQGITGLCFMELDPVAAGSNAVLPINWTPPSFYIPSAPSIITQVSDSLESISRMVKQFEGVPIMKLSQDVEKLLTAVTQVATDAQVGEIREKAVALLTEAEGAVRRVREIAEAPAMKTLPADLAATVAEAKELVAATREQLPKLMKSLEQTADQLGRASGRVDKLLADERLEKTLKDLTAAAADLRSAAGVAPEAVQAFNRAVKSAGDLLDEQGEDLVEILRSLRTVSGDLRDIGDEARSHPARLLFGDPPPPFEKAHP